MTSIDLGQARKHLELLRGDENAQIHFQLFIDNKTDERQEAKEFYGNLTQFGQFLNQQHSQGFGVYLTVNPTDGYARKESNIIGYDWLFADLDGLKIPSNMPLTPLFITSRDETHSHIYWPITDCCSAIEWRSLQKRIALYLSSDQQVVDPTRVLRMAGTYNLKDPNNPSLYQIVADHTNTLGEDFAYTPGEIVNAFTLPADKEIELKRWIESRESLKNGTGFNDQPIYRKKLVDFLVNKAEPAVKGFGRSAMVIRVMSMAYDLGIPLEEAQELGWQYYNPRIEPSYTEMERERKFNTYVSRAYQYANNAIGCRTASGVFTGGGAIPDPVNGWDENQKLCKNKSSEPVLQYDVSQVTCDRNTVAYITPEQAASNALSITNKSPVMDIALHFIGSKFPYRTLLRYEHVFYAYNGVNWEVMNDEEIRSEIVVFLAQWKFPPSKISNIYTYVEDLCYEKNLEQGKWLDNSDRDGKDCMIVKNGILQVTKEGVNLLPHSRDLFMLNSLKYDYDANAGCEEWLAMLDRIWPGDHDTKTMLQEWFGYCLVIDSRFDAFAEFIGKSRAGKGVITSILIKMIGEHNLASPVIEGIIKDSILDNLSKKRIAIIPEANAIHPAIKHRVLDNLKSITSGDPIEFDRKFKSAATGTAWAKITISCNEPPDFIDSSGALANRALIFPFYISFAGREDRGLKSRLETEIAGILNWSIQGLIRLMQNGQFTRSAASNEAQEDMRYDNFPLSEFIEHSCELTPNAAITDEDLYKQYLYYCDTHGIKKPMLKNKFCKYLKASSLPVIRKRSTVVDKNGSRPYLFLNITVKDSAKKPSFGNVTPINPGVKVGT